MTVDEQVAAVNDAFRLLLIRAAVPASAGDPRSAEAVCRVLASDRMQVPHTDARSPVDCPLNRWLRAATGLPDALMGERSVMLPQERVAGRRGWKLIPLPPAVRAAVAMVGGMGFPGLIRKEAC